MWKRIAIGVLVAAAMLPAQRSRRGDFQRDGDTRRNPLERSETVHAEGRQLYNRSCTMCHGADGTVGDRAPALAGTRRFLRQSDGSLFDAVKLGIPGTLMPAIPMPDNDVWKIVGYIRSLRASAYDAPPAGDVAKGEALFWGKGGCGKCHMLRGRGGLLGPDLSNVGAEMRLDALKEALTASKPLPPKNYQPVRLVTTDGTRIRGIVKNENNFSLQLIGDDDKLHLLLREEVREIAYDEKSIMPVGLDKKLGAEEFQNLLAFLSRQAISREGEKR